MNVGIVIRADGTIPFDLVDGEEHPHKHAILAHVAAKGHALDHHAHCHHHKGHSCSCHPRIVGWVPGSAL